MTESESQPEPSQTTQQPFIIDNLGPIGKHDVLIIRYSRGLSQGQQRLYYDSVRQFFRDRGIYPKIIGVLGYDVKIEALSEDEMAKYGWVKK